MRSVLFVPGVRPDRFARAMAAGADAVVFDLEDSVERARKDEARAAVAGFLAAPATSASLRLLRVNAPESEWFDADLEVASRLDGIDGLVLPKAEAARHVEEAARVTSHRVVMPLL